MSISKFTDRTRQLTGLECPRRRYIRYDMHGSGFEKVRHQVPQLAGSAVHVGLASLRKDVVEAKEKGIERPMAYHDANIEKAVKSALRVYRDALASGGLEIELGEDEEFVASEQMALVEGLLRVYHGSDDGLQMMLDRFDILEVEHEETLPAFALYEDQAIAMMARADALLAEHGTHDIYIQSDKTVASFDPEEYLHDVQALSEAFVIEQRLNEFWRSIKEDNINPNETNPTLKFLARLSEPPRIAGVEMNFLVKGQRQADETGTRRTRSKLLYGWCRDGNEFAWTHKWYGPDVNDWTGKPAGHTLGKGYRKFSAFDPEDYEGGVKGWIEQLGSSDVIPDVGDPFEGIIRNLHCFRQDRDIDDWHAQTVAMESDWVGRVQAVERTRTETPAFYRAMLNSLIYQNRANCRECAYKEICFGADQMLVDPEKSGFYKKRLAHHFAELKG